MIFNDMLINWMDQFQILDPIRIVSPSTPHTMRPYLINTDTDAIPITSITTQNDVYQAISQIEQKVRPKLIEQLSYTPQETYRFITAMAELCQNIYYHSAQRGDYHGYITMQANTHCLKFIALDLGPTIPFTLRPKYTFATDLDAIQLALKPGITSKSHGGLGLYRTQQIIEQAQGHMTIRSGRATVNMAPTGIFTSQTSALDPMSRHIWGTQVGILLPKKHKQDTLP